jgi:hypothetical protein
MMPRVEIAVKTSTGDFSAPCETVRLRIEFLVLPRPNSLQADDLEGVIKS